MYISRDVFMSLREETSICVYARTSSPYDHFGHRDIHHGRSVGIHLLCPPMGNQCTVGLAFMNTPIGSLRVPASD